MEIGTKVKIVQQERKLWAKLRNKTGKVIQMQDKYIRVAVSFGGAYGYYNFKPEELIEIESIKLKQFSAWK